MEQHPFSTPDGNKTYCKTCGCTFEGGSHPRNRADRIRGVLVGQAAGDALGANYEFGPAVPVDSITWDKKGSWEIGEWTDDTEQAIVVAAARSEAREVAQGMLGWLHSRPKDVGILTSRVLSGARTPEDVMARSVKEGEWAADHPRPGADRGSANGSLMRTGPVALPYLGHPSAIVKAARKVSDVTHYTPDGVSADITALWSLLIADAVGQGEAFDLLASLRAALDTLALTSTSPETIGYLIEVIMHGLTDDPTGRRNGGAVGAFKAALYAVRWGSGFEHVVTLAVSFGRDTDTVAAIAGALAGAVYGASAVPEQWRADLHGKTPEGTAGPGEGERYLADLAMRAAGLS